MVSDDGQGERGIWSVKFEGGPALAGNLAAAVRIAALKDWPHSPDMQAMLAGFADALNAAQFTPEGQ
jgi:hypothetical protein